MEDYLTLTEAETLFFGFFLSFFLVSDETSGDPLGGLFPASEIFVKSLVLGGLAAVTLSSSSDSSQEDPEAEDWSRPGRSACCSVSFDVVFCTTDVT